MSILMCKPDFYGIYYEINPWMHLSAQISPNLAFQQWNKLYNTLQQIGETIHLVPPVPDLPDLVFTANAALIHDSSVWISQFSAQQRQPESVHFRNWFKQAGFNVINDALAYHGSPSFEGAGDALFLGNRLIAGYGFRSQSEIYQHAFFRQFEVIPVELVNPSFYHLDTCFCPLTENLAIWYPDAFSIDAQKKLKETCELIEVSRDEAYHFACNAVCIGKEVILPVGCPELTQKLERLGFSVQACEMSEFIKAGGACKCLTLKL